jgi:AraC-like DNA-binding protein
MLPEDFAPLRVATDALPMRERLPFWREVLCRRIIGVDIEPLSEDPFQAEAMFGGLPGLQTMLWSIGSAIRLQRTPELISDGNDSLGLVVNLAGAPTYSQRGRDVSLGRSDAVVILNGEPAAAVYRQTKDFALRVPRAALAPLVTDVEDMAMLVIPHDNEALRLLMGYLKTVHESFPLNAPELRHMVVTHVHELMAMAIGPTRDGAAVAAEGGVRAARLAMIKADIVAHLCRSDLSLVVVAARQQVTPRYIQMLFEREGTTFSQFVLTQRLAHAYRMLTSPHHKSWTVSAIAFTVGFGDLSHFNRSFRRRYGATPSDVRNAI